MSSKLQDNVNIWIMDGAMCPPPCVANFQTRADRRACRKRQAPHRQGEAARR